MARSRRPRATFRRLRGHLGRRPIGRLRAREARGRVPVRCRSRGDRAARSRSPAGSPSSAPCCRWTRTSRSATSSATRSRGHDRGARRRDAAAVVPLRRRPRRLVVDHPVQGRIGRPYNVGSEADLSIADAGRTRGAAGSPGSQSTSRGRDRSGAGSARYVPSTARAAASSGSAAHVELDDAITAHGARGTRQDQRRGRIARLSMYGRSSGASRTIAVMPEQR